MTTRVRKMYVMLSSVDWKVMTWEEIRMITSASDRLNLARANVDMKSDDRKILREFIHDLNSATGSICFPIDETAERKAELYNEFLEFWNVI